MNVIIPIKIFSSEYRVFLSYILDLFCWFSLGWKADWVFIIGVIIIGLTDVWVTVCCCMTEYCWFISKCPVTKFNDFSNNSTFCKFLFRTTFIWFIQKFRSKRSNQQEKERWLVRCEDERMSEWSWHGIILVPWFYSPFRFRRAQYSHRTRKRLNSKFAH